MRRIPFLVSSLALGAALAVASASSAAAPSSSLLGFSEARAAEERALEARFDAQLQQADLGPWLKRLSARPHHLGSPYGKDNAQFLAGLFRSWGFDTAIEEFQVLFPTPKTRLVELVAPTKFTASLTETALPEDSTSGQKSEQLPTYNAYSIDGDVTGDLVYVNYGVPADYEELERQGIDVKGKIVIARYGGSWRGIKPKVAAEHGAVGCLIYSDPKDDGYFLGDVYPKGGFRPEQGAQRGSVADMPLHPGDPLTPGVGATADAKRLDRKDAATLTKIPVLPISYGDARPLLAAMGGSIAPEAWRGALPIPYHLGPGPAKVHLKLEFNWQLVPAYDVIARLPGSERPDEWIVRGNHHDGWVNGAADPLSGQIALLEEAKAVGALAKAGFRPKRTIVYAAWDGEEPGLLGSTEWVETHAAELAAKGAVYINSDSNSRGFLSVGGSHTLEPFVNEVARDVTDPETGVSVGERLLAQRIVQGTPEERKEIREKKLFHLYPLGSGSDYTPFLQHIGVASLNIEFDGEGDYGQYHSIYDTYDHYTRFMDPTFAYGIVLAKTAGRLTLRLATADVLPVDFKPLAEAVSRYSTEVVKLADDLRGETEERNRRITDKVFTLVDDPAKKLGIPKAQEPVPHLNLAPVENAVEALKKSAKAYGQALEAATAGGRALPPEAQKALDAALIAADRALMSDAGLPRRPWFRHQIYAPGFYTGYGVKTLPAVREAIEQRNYPEAEAQAVVVGKTIIGLAAAIDRATAILAGAK
jgi:N-acetylated-alpha-linked acidic dipeptidase